MTSYPTALGASSLEHITLLGTDLAVRRELAARGVTDTLAWAPWRSYATMHLWRAAAKPRQPIDQRETPAPAPAPVKVMP